MFNITITTTLDITITITITITCVSSLVRTHCLLEAAGKGDWKVQGARAETITAWGRGETFGFGTLSSVTILTVAERFAQLEDLKYDKADLVEILDCDWAGSASQNLKWLDEAWYSAAADAIAPKLRGNKILRTSQARSRIICQVSAVFET